MIDCSGVMILKRVSTHQGTSHNNRKAAQ